LHSCPDPFFIRGIILFLVALLSVIQQFEPVKVQEESAEKLSLQVAIYPLAFPTIVTPYGISAVIVFNALSHDLHSKLIVGEIVAGIMMLEPAGHAFRQTFI
jgi:small neutral amino acid transporter SnatA (MarC family)